MSKKLLVIEAKIFTEEKCEFSNFTCDYVQGYDEEICNDPAPFLLVYHGFECMMWACEHHKNEQVALSEGSE